LKLLRGETRKSRLRGEALTIADTTPLTPPAFLDGEGLAEWLRLEPLLRGAGLLTALDRMALTVLVEVWARWLDVQRAVAAEGATVVKRGGASQPHPLLRAAAMLANVLRLWCGEFGCTPSSRQRIRIPPPAPKSAVDRFREKHGG